MYITITGGGFVNKGAAAMTYAAVKEIEEHYPNDQIVVFCKKIGNDIDKDRFKIEEDDFYSRVYLCCPWSRPLIKKKADLKKRQSLESIFKNTKYNMDVSGYALGSTWGVVNSLIFLMKIYTGKKYHYPVYILPQSFGPFQYKGIKGIFVYHFLKKILRYPRIIYAREQQGFDLLKGIGLENVRLATDIVLTSQEEGENVNISFQQPAVAIIPNERNLDYIDENNMLNIYETICKYLREEGFNIYLVLHSDKDRRICEKIANRMEWIHYLDQEWGSEQMTALVKNFQFVVASRYHAVVHAYKADVPCMVIGWADKYKELMTCFAQEKYYIDIRTYDEKRILNVVLPEFMRQCESEKEKIKNKRGVLKQQTAFQEIRDDYMRYSLEAGQYAANN